MALLWTYAFLPRGGPTGLARVSPRPAWLPASLVSPEPRAPQRCTHIVNHEVHDGLRHEVPHGLIDDGHV